MESCNELLNNLERLEETHISTLNHALSEVFADSERRIKGLEHKLQVVKNLVDSIKDKDVVEVEISHEKNLDDDNVEPLKGYFRFRDIDTRRFLLFYTSKLYEGNFRVSADEKAISELSEKLKDVFVKVSRTGIIFYSPFQREETILFKCSHHLLDNVYFSILRFSPKGYKFFFFYDVFNRVCRFDFEKLSHKVELIQKELEKLKLVYSPDRVRHAVLLRSFQNVIIREEKAFKNVLSSFKEVFSCLDKIKSIVIASVEDVFSCSRDENSVKNIINLLDTLNINLKKLKLPSFKDYYLNKFIDKFNEILNLEREFRKILRIKEESLDVLRGELDEQRKNLLFKMKAIDNVLFDGNFNYEDVKLFQSEIPEISQFATVETIVADLKEIIKSYKGIIGKAKKFLSSHETQLRLEEEKLEKLKSKIAESLSELKSKYELSLKKLEEKISSEEENLRVLRDSYESRLSNLWKELKEIGNMLCEEIESEYKRLDEAFVKVKNEYSSKREFLEICYKDFFNQLRQKYPDVNFIKLFSKLEKLYLSAVPEKELLPQDVLKFLEFLTRQIADFEREIDIENRYNKNLDVEFPEIVEALRKLLQRDSPSFSLIEAIEEKFVEELKLIF